MSNTTSDGNRYFLSGDLNEHFEFQDLPPFPEIVVDLSGLKKINSVGITKWLSFFETYKVDKHFIFEKIPSAIVTQINMIQGFLPPNSQINSFYVQIYNGSNDEEVDFLLEHPRDVRVEKRKVVFRDNISKILPPGYELDIADFGYFRFLTQYNS